MKGHLLRPDAFCIGLVVLGAIMFFVPLTRIAGVVAIVAALAYWLTMLIVRAFYSSRNRSPR